MFNSKLNKLMMENNTKNGLKAFRKFKAAYNMLPHKKKPEVKENIMRNLGVSEVSFYQKMNAKQPLSLIEVHFIEGLFKKWNINAWTGDFIHEKATS
jgi:hypothetical protein